MFWCKFKTEIKMKSELAKKAIAEGKTLGQFLRELPESEKMTKAELQTFAKAYVAAREESNNENR